MSNPPPIPPLAKRAPGFVRLLIGAGCLFLLALLLAVPAENWRGKRAWEQCRSEFAARGESLDWRDYIPPPVPDDQNVFKAPHMSKWFVGPTNTGLAQLLDSKTLPDFLAMENPSSIVAEVTFVPLDYNSTEGNPSLLLRYDAPVLSLSTNAAADRDRIISFTNVNLPKAIDTLAHAAKINYKLNPPVDSPEFDRTNLVTCSWTNASAERVFFLLLNKYDLGWRENPRTGVLTITAPGKILVSDYFERPSPQHRTYADPQTRAAIRRVLQRAVVAAGIDSQNPCLAATAGLSFVRDEANIPNHPHFVVQTSEGEAGALFGRFFTNAAMGGSNRISLALVFSDLHRFAIVAESPCPAADYLKWSDQFEPQFTSIREALQLPYARRDGPYLPSRPPVPNFLAVRNLARTLAQRAQCDLLLGKPEDALRELTFIHDLRRLSDGESTNKYGSILSAMINVAVYQIYIGVVADGLHLHAWNDSQLLAIQKQLGELNMCALVVNGLRCERAAMMSVIETTYQPATNRIARNPLLPRSPTIPVKGWSYQNQVTVARLDQEIIDSYDLTNDLIHMDLVDSFKQDAENLGTHFRPYTFVAAIVVGDFSKALARAAFEQTTLDQGRIACAIERYRLAHGAIPDTLDALAPQFIEKLPHDRMNGHPLKYHRSSDERFQLYSVGWNQTDDGGITYTNYEQGDWVWPPAK